MQKSSVMHRRNIGKLGEDCACKYLLSKGYSILDRNYHSRFGEIDIIAKRGELVFVEVKARTSSQFGTPQSSITRRKIQRIIKTVLYFLNGSTLKSKIIWRIDLIGIELTKNGELKNITHLKNILNG